MRCHALVFAIGLLALPSGAAAPEASEPVAATPAPVPTDRAGGDLLIYRKPGKILYNICTYDLFLNGYRAAEIRGAQYVRLQVPAQGALLVVSYRPGSRPVLNETNASFVQLAAEPGRRRIIRFTSDWKKGLAVLAEVDEAAWARDLAACGLEEVPSLLRQP